MTKNIFIGVDGGGTKTKMIVEDEAGNLLGEALGGPAQIRISVDQAWNSIYTALSQILTPLNISLTDNEYNFHIGLGLAGTEFKTPYENFMSRSHSFTTLCLKSDGYAACLGAHNGKDGAIIIVGTGVKGLQIEGKHVSEVSGWGFPQGDEGSGAWIGLQTIRYTLHSLDGRLPPSEFFEAVLARFNHNLTELLNWCIDTTSTQYATIAPITMEYVAKKDPIALQIIQEAAGYINEVGFALNRHVQDKAKSLPLCLFGGISPFIEPYLLPELKKQIVARCHGAAKGAIFMVKDYLKNKDIHV